MNALQHFERFESEARSNKYLHVERACGRHCIKIHARCPEGTLALTFILRDFRLGVYRDLSCHEINYGLEVCLVDYSEILKDRD